MSFTARANAEEPAFVRDMHADLGQDMGIDGCNDEEVEQHLSLVHDDDDGDADDDSNANDGDSGVGGVELGLLRGTAQK
jgi:hypothetical protein